MRGTRCVSLSSAYVSLRLSASEPPRSAKAQARAAGRTVFIICGVIALMVIVIVGARLRSGGTIAPLSIALPGLGLLWLAVLGLQSFRYRSAVEASSARSERPSKRPPRIEPPGSTRANRTSDSGRHVSA